MAEQALDHFSGFDIVVNNAGTLRNNPIFDMGEGDWDEVIVTHLKGYFTVTRPEQKYLGNRDLDVLSIPLPNELGIGGFPSSNYAAAKGRYSGFDPWLGV